MANLSLHLLGSPYIEHNGLAVECERHKSLALLAYLATTAQRQSRDVLCALLWPNLNQIRARAALRRTLVDLNQTIGKEWLTVVDDSLALTPSPHLQVDLWQYHNLLAAASIHIHPPSRLCSECMSLLNEAVTLYSGDFMAGFSVLNASDFDTWLSDQAEMVRRELAGTLEKLAYSYADRGEYDQAIKLSQRQLRLDPLQEESHRLLMRVYAWAGNRSAALQQADICTQLLRTELGLAPQHETVALARSIRSGVTSRLVNIGDAGTPPPRPQLPAALTPFFGREGEQAYIVECLADPTCRLLTIVGPGGCGKTRLALAVAAQTTCFGDNVFFVPLATVVGADDIAVTILKHMRVPPCRAQPVRRQLLECVQGDPTLLILDNFEHLLHEIELVLEMLGTAPALKILVTSRERLKLTGEWIAPIEGLAVPASVDTDSGESTAPVMNWRQIEQYSAIQLFLHGIRRLRPRFEPTGGEAQTIVRICQAVGGLPLAIELATSWTRSLSLDAILHGIQRDPNFLVGEIVDLPPRQRSLRAVFEHSWQQLSPRQHRLLRWMALEEQKITLDMAAQAGIRVAELADLVDRSWLRVSQEGCFAMNEPTRRFCLQTVTESQQV